jgi:predicted nucleic acid-binding protein
VKLLDTTIAVDHLRGEPAAVGLLATVIDTGEVLAASELIRFELLAGIRDKELGAFEEFCSALRWAQVTEDVTRVGGRLARRYRRSHSGIGPVDYLIAATAIVIDADLLTTNVRHFPMFAGLGVPVLTESVSSRVAERAQVDSGSGHSEAGRGDNDPWPHPLIGEREVLLLAC